MGQDSKIEWTHHTFNPWRGCTKVSQGCKNCYAETLSHRNPKTLGIWGDDGTRVIAAESAWREPSKWNKAAKAAGERHRVFCASLADVFEDREELVEPRVRLFHLINETPHLDWLLLTKRPENVRRFCDRSPGSWALAMPSNVWLGTSVEDQATADARIPHLFATPAAVRFLSMEPLLGPVDLGDWDHECGDPPHGNCPVMWPDWVIVGGESGPNARPMHPDWARSIRDQCVAAGVPFFFKQWGEWSPAGSRGRHCFNPGASIHDLVTMDRVGKKAAGRMLDGRTWDETPESHGPLMDHGQKIGLDILATE